MFDTILWTVVITGPIAYFAGSVGVLGKIFGYVKSKTNKGLGKLK